MKQFEEEKVKWEQQREAAAKAGKTFDDEEPTMDEERERAWQVGKRHQGSIRLPFLRSYLTCRRQRGLSIHELLEVESVAGQEAHGMKGRSASSWGRSVAEKRLVIPLHFTSHLSINSPIGLRRVIS